MAEIAISGFSGMNSLIPAFFSGKNTVSPRIVLNADVDGAGKLSMRDGYTLYLTLAGSHSLWACETCMLCAAAGKLYSIGTGVAVELDDIDGTGPLDYTLCESKVYVSNAYWSAVVDPSDNSVSDWGISLPPGPMITVGTGNLPAGLYHVCFTNVSDGEISGNGPISSIELTSEGGITVLNRPTGALVWATDKYGHVFSLVGEVATIVDIPLIEPLPSFMCVPPPNMTGVTYAFGRMWGAAGPELYYSEPYRPGWFKLNSNRFKFESDIKIIAMVPTGLFIGLKDRTVFLAGTEPEQMKQTNAGAGSVNGTLAYCNNLPELGDVLGTPEKGYVDVPVWRTTEGIVAGNASGRLFNLTKNKLTMGVPERGASLYRQKDGEFQFLTSASQGIAGSGEGTIDAVLKAALLAGKLPMTNKMKDIPTTSGIMQEDVSCEVRRGGVLI